MCVWRCSCIMKAIQEERAVTQTVVFAVVAVVAAVEIVAGAVRVVRPPVTIRTVPDVKPPRTEPGYPVVSFSTGTSPHAVTGRRP